MVATTKYRFTNRHDLEIVALVERPEQPTGLLFIMHGMFGCKEQAPIRTLARAGLEQGLCVVSFDATHSIGESGGDPAQSTITTAVDDLADLLVWSQQQTWYQSPFILAGYSMGSMAALEYADRHPENLQGLAVLGCVVTGRLTYEAAVAADAAAIAEWRDNDFRTFHVAERDNLPVAVPWQHIEDRFHYDALKYAPALCMPVFMFSGMDDIICTAQHQRQLFDKLGSGNKCLHLIPNVGHTYATEQELTSLAGHFKNWLETIV